MPASCPAEGKEAEQRGRPRNSAARAFISGSIRGIRSEACTCRSRPRSGGFPPGRERRAVIWRRLWRVLDSELTERCGADGG